MTSGSLGRRSSTDGRSPLATRAASMGGSLNEDGISSVNEGQQRLSHVHSARAA
jgi:hypothetical protein